VKTFDLKRYLVENRLLKENVSPKELENNIDILRNKLSELVDVAEAIGVDLESFPTQHDTFPEKDELIKLLRDIFNGFMTGDRTNTMFSDEL